MNGGSSPYSTSGDIRSAHVSANNNNNNSISQSVASKTAAAAALAAVDRMNAGSASFSINTAVSSSPPAAVAIANNHRRIATTTSHYPPYSNLHHQGGVPHRNEPFAALAQQPASVVPHQHHQQHGSIHYTMPHHQSALLLLQQQQHARVVSWNSQQPQQQHYQQQQQLDHPRVTSAIPATVTTAPRPPPSTTMAMAPAATSKQTTATTTPKNTHAATRPKPQHYHYYLVVHLERQHLQEPWGLSLSWFHQRYLLISGLKQQRVHAKLRLSQGYLCPTDPRAVFWENDNGNDNGNDDANTTTNTTNRIPTFCQHLMATCPAVAAQRILPGDCIVALNGHSIQALGRPSTRNGAIDTTTTPGGMSRITSVMKQTCQMTLVLLRDAQAVAQFGNQHNNNNPSEQELANRAVHYLAQRYDSPLDKASLQQDWTRQKPKKHKPPKPVVRNVTPGTTSPKGATPQHQRSLSMVPAKKRLDEYSWTLIVHRNPLIQDEHGNDVPYDDNDNHPASLPSIYWMNPEEGQRRDHLFVRKVTTDEFPSWLQQRKEQWRKRYNVYRLPPDDEEAAVSISFWKDEPRTVATDFWSQSGHASFQHWLTARKRSWSTRYSWNQSKRQRIERDVEQVVVLSLPTFDQWLRVRKNQWRVTRRKLQLKRQQRQEKGQGNQDDKDDKKLPATNDAAASTTATTAPIPHVAPIAAAEVLAIDAVIEEQERKRKAAAYRKPFDLSLLLDPAGRAPDDVVAHFMGFLSPLERLLLLRLNSQTKDQLTSREQVWRSLCPSHWKLPRRPRKPWHLIYWTNLKTEMELAKKRSDDLLIRAGQILFKGDQFQAIEKMVTKAENDWGRNNFDINYCSGVVCERNSLLNLAVIHKRHKVVRWLVETKGADIESTDRGNFTPLLNAAWAGDRWLVRFFLCRGANRQHVGTCHYTKPLAAPDFEGLTAAGWAAHRGHAQIAKLIELGL